MTNKEAIRLATGLRTDFKCESDTMVDFCNIVIKALTALDKIKTYIIAKHLKNIEHDDYSNEYSVTLEEILSIIDKCNAESEVQESEG